MATIKLLTTVFARKTNKNLNNMNYLIFKRPNNFIIPSANNILPSNDYSNLTKANTLHHEKLLFLREIQIKNKLNTNYKSTKANEAEDCPCPDEKSDKQSKGKKDSSADKKQQINPDELKEKGATILYKSIAYTIYATEVVLASNELKLLKQVAIKAYLYVLGLFRLYVLQNPNIKDALKDVRGGKKD